MTAVAAFAPALGDWIRHHLGQGASVRDLIEAMAERGIAHDVARAIVDAVRERLPLPLPAQVDAFDPRHPQSTSDTVPAYRADPPRLARGPSFCAGSRTIRIATRIVRPTLAVLTDVLDADECAELIERARDRLRPSTLVDPRTGEDVVAAGRRCFGMFFRPSEDAFVDRIDRRIAAIMNLPLGHGEGLQVLHYPCGGGSAPHFDYLMPSNDANRASIARSGQRTSTLVTYLNDVEAGGETLFPAIGAAVSPRRGNAVYFEYCNRFGEVDEASLHASSPVLEGEKWVATKWMRQKVFVGAPRPVGAGRSPQAFSG